MPSINETGHAVNLANFARLIEAVRVFGEEYAPSNTDLTVAALTAARAPADRAQNTLMETLAAATVALNTRADTFAPLDKLVTRVLAGLASTKAPASLKRDVKSLADRIRGFGVRVEKLPDGSPDPADVSNSHQSFVQRQAAFQQMIDLLEREPLYAPAEEPLTVAALQALSALMKGQNDTIGDVLAPLAEARYNRNVALYAADTGLLDLALSVKAYVKSLYGARDARTKIVSGIPFKRPSPEQIGELTAPA